MKYKGYTAYYQYDAKVKILHGEVVGIKDIITFQGRNMDELENAFKGSVDDYLNWCKKTTILANSPAANLLEGPSDSSKYSRNPSRSGVQKSIIKRMHYLEEKIDKLQQENESLKLALGSLKQITEELYDTINK